ncbi:MAG: carbon-nitrogen hydrolase family protein, partial [Bacteroidetes bacterium]|nr:carbon-nitrogen hydrolase family protein [Bacteroidota bacterium]
MKISVAQIESFKGEIQRNMDHHLTFIQRAVHENVDVIVFPELSLTGYEPELAEALATEIEDSHFDMFQRMSNLDHIIIGVGMPIRSKAGIHIGMILFQPHRERQVYYKKYLH